MSRDREILGRPGCGLPGHSAAEAVELAGAAPVTATLSPRVKKGRKLPAENQDRAPVINPWHPGIQPVANRVLVHTEQPGDLLHRVGTVDLDAPRVAASHANSWA